MSYQDTLNKIIRGIGKACAYWLGELRPCVELARGQPR